MAFQDITMQKDDKPDDLLMLADPADVTTVVEDSKSLSSPGDTPLDVRVPDEGVEPGGDDGC